jgi:serine/threonine-protein kinase
MNESERRFTLSTDGKSYRYYLVWITKLGDGQQRAQLSEIRLFQKVAA